MKDVYALVKGRLAALLTTSGLECSEEEICVRARYCEASTALALSRGLNAAHCAEHIPPDDWVQRVYARDGHICFELSQAFYREMVSHINACSPLPELPAETDTAQDYALARMLMAARNGGEEDVDAELKKLLWTAFALTEACPQPAALRKTVEGALRLYAAQTIQKRDALIKRSGAACACVARLLACFPLI